MADLKLRSAAARQLKRYWVDNGDGTFSEKVDIGGASITLSGEVEVKNDAGNPVPVDDPNTQAAIAALQAALTAGATLDQILTELGQKLEPGGEVALDAATLAALESISAASTIADGADAAGGTTTDAAVVTDADGTRNGFLRGLVKILADVWSDALNALRTVAVPASAAALSNVASAATNTTIVAANANRRGVLIFNDDANPLKIKYGATASATSYSVEIPSDGYWEMPQPIYTGIIDGIWDADGAGSARVTELT